MQLVRLGGALFSKIENQTEGRAKPGALTGERKYRIPKGDTCATRNRMNTGNRTSAHTVESYLAARPRWLFSADFPQVGFRVRVARVAVTCCGV